MTSYGTGAYAHGELLLTPEHDRLYGKRAFLQLVDHLIRHEEILKAEQLLQRATPWHLRDDRDLRYYQKMVEAILRPFRMADEGSTGALIKYIKYDEKSAGPLTQKAAFAAVKQIPRIRWIMDRVIAENPATILDVGAGWGEIAVELASLNYHVTAIAPFEEGADHAKKVQAERNLAITWIHKVFQDTYEDFEDTQFDVVLCCEVLEHVIADRRFLGRCCDLAKKAVIITTPYGSVDRGLKPTNVRTPHGQHVRSYSAKDLEELVNDVATLDFKISYDTVPEGVPLWEKTNHLVKLTREGKEATRGNYRKTDEGAAQVGGGQGPETAEVFKAPEEEDGESVSVGLDQESE